MSGRPVYTLTIWAQESRYTAADWETVFQSFAHDGVDTVYFWVSGHFPSKQFPQAYKCKNVFDGKLYDTTEETQIGTVQDLNDIVGSAHKLGLKIYLGGALGGWCGTQFLTNLEPDTLKIGPKEPSLCPSNPKCRKALVEYYQEIFAAIPEADGLFIESTDEIGECKCDLCSKPVDALGSKQFGQSQLSLCQEIMSAVWRDHPQAHLAYTVGYQEHVKDVAYYSLIKRLSEDPRFEWMEARNSWSFPGPSGEVRPASFFSKKFMHWNQDANTTLETIIGNAKRAKGEGMCGLVTCFSPGFDKGVFYKDIPIPTDALPHALTGFVYREATWSPDLTVKEMHDLAQRRFFGKEAPKNLSDDLWKLREIMRTKKGIEQVAEIEEQIQKAHSNASPKTLEGLAIMTRAVNDIHKYQAKKKLNGVQGRRQPYFERVQRKRALMWRNTCSHRPESNRVGRTSHNSRRGCLRAAHERVSALGIQAPELGFSLADIKNACIHCNAVQASAFDPQNLFSCRLVCSVSVRFKSRKATAKEVSATKAT